MTASFGWFGLDGRAFSVWFLRFPGLFGAVIPYSSCFGVYRVGAWL